jgi:hypothetical protein
MTQSGSDDTAPPADPQRPEVIAWSHLSMKAYKHFLVCDLCGAMIHNSRASSDAHERFHERLEFPVVGFDPADGGNAVMLSARLVEHAGEY